MSLVKEFRHAVIYDDAVATSSLLHTHPELGQWNTWVDGSPLHLAARWGNTNAAQAILDNFPELTKKQDDRGDTPLHIAAYAGAEAENMLRFLLKRDPMASFIRNKTGHTFLDLARDPERTQQIFIATTPQTAMLYNASPPQSRETSGWKFLQDSLGNLMNGVRQL